MKALKLEEFDKIKDISKSTKKSGLDKHQYKTKKPPREDDQKSVKNKCLFCLQICVMEKERCLTWGKPVQPVVKEITLKPP